MAQSKQEISQSQVQRAGEFLRGEAGLTPSSRVDLGMVLGSGLGEVAASVESGRRIPFDVIPHFPVATVEGHQGAVVLGTMGGLTVCCLQGRLHYYEGHSLETVTFPIRVMAALGVRVLILTNAAGSLSRKFRAGDLMIVRDHIGLFLPNPLRGPNPRGAGPRFPDQSRAWSKRLRELAAACAGDLGIRIEEGVYVAVPGPSFETPAEVRMLRNMGADAVGMSTVPEAIVAGHLGMECLGISVIANLAAGLSGCPATQNDVLQVADGAGTVLRPLIASICSGLARM